MPCLAARLCCTHDRDNGREYRRMLPPPAPRLPGLAAAWAAHAATPLPPPSPRTPLSPMSCLAAHTP
ncbi:hypothetical protein E2562_000949 [Oryza meyeriana var. granulata]|uniref:Uncharacterized protein n=1 Tax=Oryza meyeriana var. granulata TaxID=110450 RepID=A0A6G1D096_9ORYZ|nr:hypothetical protein E2562_000949 [Oryza meyeriana var. granulata]